ncbi:MAG: hypothetical protein ACR2NP_08080, partial [Pirellulaceae bacterium]
AWTDPENRELTILPQQTVTIRLASFLVAAQFPANVTIRLETPGLADTQPANNTYSEQIPQ